MIPNVACRPWFSGNNDYSRQALVLFSLITRPRKSMFIWQKKLIYKALVIWLHKRNKRFLSFFATGSPFDSRSFRTRLRGGISRFSKLKVSRTLFRTKCNLSQPASFIRNSILRPTISSDICNTQGTFLIPVLNSSCESTSFEMTYV